MTAELVPCMVLAAFFKDPTTCTVEPLGAGNINDTYLVSSTHKSFVLQMVNRDVFPKPIRVINNFQKITSHLISNRVLGSTYLQVATPVLTLEKRLFFLDNKGNFWRGQSYLPHKSRRVLEGHDQAYRVGRALATFHRLVGNLDVEGFLDPLPNFHILPCYLKDYDRELRNLETVGGEELYACMSTVERYRPKSDILENAKIAGILALQPIHGDPKVDNFLFGEQGEVLGLLDLDTVAMGLVHYDLGDCLRSCCNRAGESANSDIVPTFDVTFCQALLDGYFSGPEEILSNEQRAYIFDAVLLICYELGVRFFTDHLRGNPYFKVRQEGDNLLRAVNQFRLVDDIAEREKEIRAMAMTAGCG